MGWHYKKCWRRCGAFIKVPCLSLIGFLSVCGLSACSRTVAPVSETEYAAQVVGEWRGIVGDTNETISFAADGKFISQVRPRGFISNTLGEGVTGTIRGTWAINGKCMTLNISSAENERVVNSTTSSTIETFRPNELVVKSDNGDTSTFVRL
jgi:hypothetical protein